MKESEAEVEETKAGTTPGETPGQKIEEENVVLVYNKNKIGKFL